jgi:hypothetical protein
MLQSDGGEKHNTTSNYTKYTVTRRKQNIENPVPKYVIFPVVLKIYLRNTTARIYRPT